MELGWRRPKTIPSQTEHIETECGTLHFTKGFEDEKLIEVRATIGKNGICSNVCLDSFCKVLSMLLQSSEPRYKIVKKIKKQFIEVNCGQPFKWQDKNFTSCVDKISQSVVGELEKQIN